MDLKENKLNKAVIFVFFVHKKIYLRLNYWCRMYYFIDFTTFLGLEGGRCVAIYAGSESAQI